MIVTMIVLMIMAKVVLKIVVMIVLIIELIIVEIIMIVVMVALMIVVTIALIMIVAMFVLMIVKNGVEFQLRSTYTSCCGIFVSHSSVERVDLHFDHLCLCVYFLTTLLLVNTIDTGFSLVDFNEALEVILLV